MKKTLHAVRNIVGVVVGLAAGLAHGVQYRVSVDDYAVLRMNEAPAIDITLVPSTENPGGIGEPATALIGPAVANAVFAATGKRVRKLPLTQANITSA